MGATREIADWAAGLRYEDLPERVVERTKAQLLSVLGAVGASRHSEATIAAVEASRERGGPEETPAFTTGDRLPRLEAVFANACASAAFDFDDYLFAGHTGHSAVCAALAYGEVTGASGRDVLTAAVVGNEAGGRLGASFLLGPHNGQMWSYIHLLESVCVAGRLLGLDADRLADGIGIAFTQPPFPLMPAFMGPDSKVLIAAEPTVTGCRAAELAAHGWSGSHAILEDRQGMLRKFNPDHLGWMLSGLGEAWVSDSLTYKIVPGCAYIDTAMDAFEEIGARFHEDEGRELSPDDVDAVDVDCGMFTNGMEQLSERYRSPDRVDAVSVNFSVRLSVGLRVAAGSLASEHLSRRALDERREAIEGVADKITMTHDPELDRRAGKLAAGGGFDLRALLAGDPDVADPDGDAGKSLSGASFEGYVMAFPAEVRLRTTSGRTYEASQDVPLGGAGRPWKETADLVREKFRRHGPGDVDRALSLVDRLEDVTDVGELASALAP